MIEGAVLSREALAAGVELEALYLGPGAPDDLRDAGVEVVEVGAGVIERVASTVTSQPVLAVARTAAASLDQLAGATFLVVCVGLADPGNAGTILRTAEAAGADGVVLTAGSVDPRSPKVVRASAGALFHVPVVTDVALAEVRELGVALLGAVATGGVAYDEAPFTEPFALVLGNEAHGLGAEERSVLDGLVSIPHAGRAESLNVAMAAAVLCFEARRRRAADEARGASATLRRR